jgi:hypothetical protein
LVPEAKTTGPIAKKVFLFILEIIFFGKRVGTCFAAKSFVKCEITFSCTNVGQYWLSTVYFLGDFNETFRLLLCSCPSTDVPSFVEKYPKKKYRYAIFVRPNHLGMDDLCETSLNY